MKIGGIGLFVEDINKMVSFYRDVMLFETDWDGGLFATFKTKDSALFMYDRKDFAKAISQDYYSPNGINLTMEICFDVPGFADVDQEYDRLTQLGIKSITGAPVTQPWGQRNFFFTDPEGNIIEIGAFENNKSV
jgi:lactoylglutathione lyase